MSISLVTEKLKRVIPFKPWGAYQFPWGAAMKHVKSDRWETACFPDGSEIHFGAFYDMGFDVVISDAGVFIGKKIELPPCQ